jgi:uncharacterized DUF497 family protein
MLFDWDEHKADINLKKHGIRFSEAISLFLTDHVCFELQSEPEQRYAIIGKFEKSFYTGIFTLRLGKVRIISVRRSRPKEERYYGTHFK